MPIRKLREFLDAHGVRYVSLRHSPAFTAQEIAAAAHIPGQELAKTVVVEIDGRTALVVLPATQRVDLGELRDVTGARAIALVDEATFRDRFPDCEAGAMPPFGNLYGMEVVVSDTLAEDDEIAFNAGSHAELVRMKYDDFARLVRPRVARFTERVR